MEMIILRTTKPAATGGPIPVGTLAHGRGELSVKVEDLSRNDMANVRRDPQVIASAPPMPMSLVKPTARAAVTKPPEVCWGIQAVGAADSEFTGDGVTVAVLDTGIDPACGKKNKPQPFTGVEIVTQNFTGDTAWDTEGHGTHCAGTIFGRDTDGCRIGVAPGVKKALIGKVLGPGGGSTDAIFKAILWAYQQEAHVISMSLGMDFPGYRESLSQQFPPSLATLATSMALEGYRSNVRLFDRLSQVTSGFDGTVAGTVVVAAAGNESQRDLDAKYRITVAPPAAAEQFLSVAALGHHEPGAKAVKAKAAKAKAAKPKAAKKGEGDQPYFVAPFSNTGARLSAPGVDIVSAKLGGGLVSMNGTSMATPHVAGVAALWVEKLMKLGKPFLARDVIWQIEKAAQGLPYLEAEDVGLGLVQAP